MRIEGGLYDADLIRAAELHQRQAFFHLLVRHAEPQSEQLRCVFDLIEFGRTGCWLAACRSAKTEHSERGEHYLLNVRYQRSEHLPQQVVAIPTAYRLVPLTRAD